MNKTLKTPEVSIIIPVFNTEASFLRKCLDSILAQTFKNFELIIIDDSSTDKEAIETLNNYKKSDSRVNLVRLKKNSGVSAARNAGIEKSQGKYLLFVDADDYLNSDYLHGQLETAKTSKCEIVFPVTIRLSGDKRKKCSLPTGVKELPKDIQLFIDDDWLFSARGVLYAASYAKKERFKEGQLFAEDTDYSMRVIRDRNFVVSPQSSYFYVQHAKSVMHDIDCAKADTFISGCFEMLESVAKIYPSKEKQILALKYSSLCHISRCLIASRTSLKDYKGVLLRGLEKCEGIDDFRDGISRIRKIRGRLLRKKHLSSLFVLEKATRPVWRKNV